MTLRNLVLIMVSLFTLTIFSCSKSNNDYGGVQPPSGGNGNGGGTTTTINISSTAFPASTTVKKGTTIKWNNQDNMAHTVTSNDGTTFNSGNLAAGATFSYTANAIGSFPYHCAYHSGMTGTLIVIEQ